MKKTIITIGIILALIIIALPIEHYYGDNIYGAFAFRNEDVIKVSDSKYRTHKDKPECFNEYMKKQGWSFIDQMGSCIIFEKDTRIANCVIEFKEFYAEYNVTYESKNHNIEFLKENYPQLELMNVYGKGPYDIYYEKDKVIFSNEVDYVTDKSTWTVAWSQNENTAEMQNAKLIVEEDNQTIYEEDIKINNIEDEKIFIHGGWNCYVLIDSRFEVKCNNPKSAKAYILLKDSNDIEYIVFLNRTDFHKENPNEASFDIIIKYKNSTFSIWDYYDLEDFTNNKLNLS